MRNLFVFLLLLFAAIPVAHADHPTGRFLDSVPQDCYVPGVDQGECWVRMRDTVDRELNQLYSELIRNANSDQKKNLRDMQRGWIAMREAQCALVESYESQRDNFSWSKRMCEIVMTKSRIWELNEVATGIRWQGDD